MVDSVAHAEVKAVAQAMRTQMRRMDDWVDEQNRTGGAALYRWINPRKTHCHTEMVGGALTSDPATIVGAKRLEWSRIWRERRGYAPAPELPHIDDAYVAQDIREAFDLLRQRHREEGNGLTIPRHRK